jgi:receptor protein-tyrosine kinase
MNLIEQAAKRLEELRRAGAGLPEGEIASGQPGGAPEPSAGNVPTPEAAVHALGARAVKSAASVARIRRHGRAVTLRIDARPRPAPVRSVDIDIEKLKQLGFVTPDAPSPRSPTSSA